MSMLPTMFKNNPRSHLHGPLNMDIWDSFKEFHETMAAQHAPLRPNTVAPSIGGVTVEWSETPEAHVLTAKLPGLKREEVRVKVKEGRFLKISAKKKVEKEEKHDHWHHFESTKAKFSRVFTLPQDSRPDRVKSCFENALLTVTVPKRDVNTRSRDVVMNVEVKG